MKIVDITEFYSERGGGIRSHLTTRGHVLCQLGHDHAVIAPGPRDEESPARAIADTSQLAGAHASNAPSRSGPDHVPRVLRVAGPALPYDRTYHLLGRLDKVRALAIAERPDVLEAHSPYLATAAVIACGRTCARLRTAFWHTDHLGAYVEPSVARVLGERAAETVVRPLWVGVRALLAPFDATFVAGVAQAERLRAVGVPRVVHVPFGVDRRTFHPRERDEALRRALTGGAPGPVLVGAGRFAIEKRWDVVLDAFARVRAGEVGDGAATATLVLYGDGPERARLERRAPPGVRFAGFERDPRVLAAALASADVLVHGCPCETFGLATAEAVACGLPIVVPDRGGAAQSADPSCSETYRSLDAGACAAAVGRVLARGRRDPAGLRARALEASARVSTVEEHFTRVLAVYEELLQTPRMPRMRAA